MRVYGESAMVIAEILAPSEDIQAQIFNKTTSQLKKKKKESLQGRIGLWDTVFPSCLSL